MREAIKDRGRLEHMLSAIENVEEFTKDISLDDFVKSKVLFFAVVKNIEIVGEATYMLTKEYLKGDVLLGGVSTVTSGACGV